MRPLLEKFDFFYFCTISNLPEKTLFSCYCPVKMSLAKQRCVENIRSTWSSSPDIQNNITKSLYFSFFLFLLLTGFCLSCTQNGFFFSAAVNKNIVFVAAQRNVWSFLFCDCFDKRMKVSFTLNPRGGGGGPKLPAGCIMVTKSLDFIHKHPN